MMPDSSRRAPSSYCRSSCLLPASIRISRVCFCVGGVRFLGCVCDTIFYFWQIIFLCRIGFPELSQPRLWEGGGVAFAVGSFLPGSFLGFGMRGAKTKLTSITQCTHTQERSSESRSAATSWHQAPSTLPAPPLAWASMPLLH